MGFRKLRIHFSAFLEQLETQNYMIIPIFLNEEVNQLHALRSKTSNCKMNFKNRYGKDDLLCNLCFIENQDQQNMLRCNILHRKLQDWVELRCSNQG